jgi:prolyl oligopeptidase
MRAFRTLFYACAALCIAMTTHTTPAGAADHLPYPQTRTVNQVDDYFGTQVSDPYRWLEELTSSEVKSWVEAQNKVTFDYLAKIDGRDRLLKRFKQLSNYPRYSMPGKTGGRYFWSKNDGLQNQYVLYWSDTLSGEAHLLLDPNTWSNDGTVALAGSDTSDDGRKYLFAKSSSGSDWKEWYVLDIDSGTQLPDVVKWSKGGAQWNKDASGFYYDRNPEPAEGEEFTAAARNESVWFHKLGTSQHEDVEIFSMPDKPDWLLGFGLNEERNLGLIYVTPRGSIYSKIYALDLNDPAAKPQLLIDDNEHEYSFVNNEGSRVWFTTTKNAPLGKLISFDRSNPAESAWQTIIPEGRYPLQGVSYVGGELFVSYLKDARTQYLRYTLDGKLLGEVKLPGRGTVYGFGGRKADTETFYSYVDYCTPTTMYRYDIPSGKSTFYKKYEVPVDTSQYETHQVFVRSVDGIAIPMFLTHKRGLKLDGNNPVLLYGYGGFGGTQQPYFSSSNTAWYDMGGVYAVAGIRGGAEYGEDWHRAGMREGRPLTFQDMIACAEWLIDNDYTSTPHLALMGGSQGGMMVGAVVNARPDLFGVAVPQVGVMDMLRFPLWGYGSYWEGDYGSPQDPEMFPVLYSYSPYHNLKAGVRYPATLVTTADTDDRVMPGHSFKYAARLQSVQPADGPPVLLRVETSAGHGAGKPLDKALAEYADEFGFIAYQMGLTIPTWE